MRSDSSNRVKYDLIKTLTPKRYLDDKWVYPPHLYTSLIEQIIEINYHYRKFVDLY